ncbi:hypothetical protein GYN07_20970 [Rhizobium leguminosarum bv. viciae 248]|uniref:hypothetical protein n=1 Tax=Rhizobium leguminosarum TaxID=384 RepID=UPI000372AB21|nr:hypothetical protein [Rhizobium leguminosarum]QHW22802.1 hypothetical protein GYN07_20970 [Rhizobium leguminosarum bv. viciae 248]
MVPPVGRSPGAFVFSSLRGPRIMLAPDEGAGAAGGAGDAGAAGAGAGGAGDEGGAGGAGAGAEKPVRPDYLPQSLWDPEKGFKVDYFNDLAATKAERDTLLASVPEKPDGYKVSLPQDFKLPEGFEVPDGESIIDENDPRISAARDFAHANQLTQEQFEGMIAIGVQADIAEKSSITEALTKQREELGAKATERVNAVTTWLGAKIGGELAGALAPMLYTAKQVQAFEKLMLLNRGAVPGNPGGGRDGMGGSTQIEGYDKMNFRQRMAAIDRAKTGN